MVEVLHPHLNRQEKGGGQRKLSVEDQLLLVLESAVCRFIHKVERLLMHSGKFRQQVQKAAFPKS